MESAESDSKRIHHPKRSHPTLSTYLTFYMQENMVQTQSSTIGAPGASTLAKSKYVQKND